VSGTFSARTDELRRQTRCDRGTMTGSVEVDQVYAHVQHERLDYKHPRGGQARYLAAGLEANYHEYLQAVADGVLDDGGRDGMRRAMEHLSGEVYDRAPREFMDLRRSGHPQVRQGLDVLYDRPPMQHRLSEAELRAKSRLRYAGLPDRLKGWIWWHVQHHLLPPPRRH
jgi:hypothetical protein